MRVLQTLAGDVALQCLDYCSLTSKLDNVDCRISCPINLISCPIGASFGRGHHSMRQSSCQPPHLPPFCARFAPLLRTFPPDFALVLWQFQGTFRDML
jgi:hypothetical protein